jgi:tetratricopeptide (TPR) repeat protein
MITNKTINRLIELLQDSDLIWLLPNLRQDFVVWNNLNDPEYFEKFTQLKPSGTEFTPSDFSPFRLALVALDQANTINGDHLDLLDSIDNQVLQTAIHGFNTQTLFQINPPDLATAGLIAIALAYKYRTTNSWNSFLDTIQDKPGTYWFSPLVCLYGYNGQNIGLLNSLVQPGASSMRMDLAVHVVLSNPILPNDQIAILMGLCHGAYGDLLPAYERLSLVRSLYEQRPQSAVEFCMKWLEIHPISSKSGPNNLTHPIENINRLAENLFQIEVNKIAGKSHNLSELLDKEKEIIQFASSSLINHYTSQISKIQKGRFLTQEISEIREQIIRPNGHNSSQNKISINQAELALILANQGLYDDANQLLPHPETSLPDDPHILYSIAKISEKSGNRTRASEATARIMDLLEHKDLNSSISVWGDHLSLVNLGTLLLDLHMSEHASNILDRASKTCPNDATILKLLADSYKYSHKDQEAADILRSLISLYPDNLDYRRAFALSLESTGDWEAGLKERSIILESNRKQSDVLPLDDFYTYANSALKANHPELTLNICNDLLVRDQEDSQALIFSGKAYLQSGETDKGMELLIRATQVSPHLSDAWLALAEAQKDIFPIKTVIETLSNASQAVPDSSQIHFTLGDLYIQDNAPTLALPELQTAVALSPEDPQILVCYGQALKLIGNIDESREVLSKAYLLEPTFPGLAQLYAKILVDMGELEDAISPLEMLINSKSSQDLSAYMEYARCVLSLNKLGSTKIPPMKALIALNEVLQIDPEIAEAKALIAETLAANGDKEMAFQAYREALDTSLVGDKNWLERLSYGFGCVASSIGKHDIAIAALQEAGQVNPSNPDVFKALSRAYLEADLPEDAFRSARNVLVIDGDDPDNLAWFAKQATNLIRNEKPDFSSSPSAISKTIPSEALNALAKAIQLAPTRTDLLVQLGNFQFSIGALAEAQQTFTSIASFEFATIDDLKTASEFLSSMGNHVAAIACLENGSLQDQKAVDKHDPSLYAKLAQEYVKNNDHTSAINTLDKAIEILPDDHTLVSQKINILLDLGQPIEALNCIETAIQINADGKQNIDLLFLASKIDRSIGDLYAAVKYAQKGIKISCEASGVDNLSALPIQYQIQISEIYRALIQPDIAYSILQGITTKSSSEFGNEEDYLDFICLHTELALETGDQIRPDIQDLQLESSNPSFSRLMASKARLMNKAGNYKQAEQILQIAVNNYSKYDFSSNLPTWSISYLKYLTMNSIIETSLDLGLWDHAVSGSLQIMESSSGEPLSYLNLAKATVLEAEFYNLCEITDVSKHKPPMDSVSKETLNQFTKYLENVKSILEPYKTELFINGHELTDEQIFRWQARAEIAFKQYEEINSDPVDILSHQLTPSDTAAMIYHLHQIDIHVPDSNSINKIIKIARSYPRNPAVLLQVALAINDDNPADAMKSIRSVLEQNPYSRVPTIAFCNILLAKIALNLEEYKVAQEAVEIAIDIWEDEPDWHMLAAQIYKRISDTNGAVNHLLEATLLAPKNITYHVELGKAYFENAGDDPHMLKQAQKSFENALESEPNDVPSLVLLANTQCLLNDLEKAEFNARNALMMAPNRVDIYQLLSEIVIRKNDFQGAYEYANKAIQLSPKDLQSNLILARSLSALGKHTEALTKVNTMLPTFPDSRLLHLERVNILRKINGPRAGLDELQKLVNSYPEDFSILNALAKSYLELGETENAISIAQQALKVCAEKTPRNEQANLHLLIGQVFRQTGQLDQSIQHLSEAIQLAPDRLEPYLELGLARKERREYQEALQIFEQATTIAPDDPRAPFQAGLALKESKDYKSSETMLRRAVNLAPHDLNIRRQLAAVVALNLVHNPRTGRN